MCSSDLGLLVLWTHVLVHRCLSLTKELLRERRRKTLRGASQELHTNLNGKSGSCSYCWPMWQWCFSVNREGLGIHLYTLLLSSHVTGFLCDKQKTVMFYKRLGNMTCIWAKKKPPSPAHSHRRSTDRPIQSPPSVT